MKMKMKGADKQMEGEDFNDDEDDPSKPRSAPADFDGPKANRGCTDIIGTIMLFSMWISLTIIGAYSVKNGDYKVVFNPMDYDGNICGITFNGRNMTEYPNIVYVNNFGGGVCVKECPEIENLTDVRTFLTYNGTYQADGDTNVTLKLDYVEVADYSGSENVKGCTPDLCNTDPELSFVSEGIRQGNGFADYAVDTYELLKGRCLSNPKAVEKVNAQVEMFDSSIIRIDEIDDAATFFSHLYGDIFIAKYYVFIFGFLLSLFLGFCYAQLMRVPGILNTLIWGSILATIVILFGTATYAQLSAREWENEEPREHNDRTILYTRILSYVLFGVGIIAVFLVIFLRQSIRLALACVKQAARAIGAMPIILFFPIIQCIGLFVFLVVWLVYAVNLASLGEVVLKELPTDSAITVRFYEYDDFIKRTGWYLLFCLFWNVAFFKALSQIIIAMSVSKWYFCRDKSGSIGSSTFIKSIGISTYYHSGTAAIGSLIIAIVQIIRTMVAKLQAKAKQLDNKIGEALLCCCQCCLWGFEKFIRFLNKKAYIQTAIFGTSFCTSAKDAFFLILRNAKRVAGISYVSTVLMFVGRICISFVTAGVAYIVIDSQIGSNLHSPGGPALLVLYIAYVVGDTFLDIFEMSTETILLCFIADEEMFEGGEVYADGSLRKWFVEYEEEEKKLMANSE